MDIVDYTNLYSKFFKSLSVRYLLVFVSELMFSSLDIKELKYIFN
jgi:hypothetical protein